MAFDTYKVGGRLPPPLHAAWYVLFAIGLAAGLTGLAYLLAVYGPDGEGDGAPDASTPPTVELNGTGEAGGPRAAWEPSASSPSLRAAS